MDDNIYQRLFKLLIEENAEALWRQTIQDYLESGNELTVSNYSNGWSLLHYAAENIFSELVIMLLEQGLDVDIPAFNGSTAYLVALDAVIDSAVQENDAEIDFSIVDVLVQHGADVNVSSIDGISRDSLLSQYGARATEEYYKYFPKQIMS